MGKVGNDIVSQVRTREGPASRKMLIHGGVILSGSWAVREHRRADYRPIKIALAQFGFHARHISIAISKQGLKDESGSYALEEWTGIKACGRDAQQASIIGLLHSSHDIGDSSGVQGRLLTTSASKCSNHGMLPCQRVFCR